MFLVTSSLARAGVLTLRRLGTSSRENHREHDAMAEEFVNGVLVSDRAHCSP